MSGPPKHVLMTADTVGGVWQYALTLVRELEEYGMTISLATSGRPLSASQRRAAAALRNLALYESRFKLEWMDDPWNDIAQSDYWMLELAETLKLDLIHCNNYSSASLPFAQPVVLVGHSCVCSWFRAVRGSPAPSTWDLYRRVVRLGLRSAQYVTAPTQHMLQELRREYGAFRSRGSIYNGAHVPPLCVSEKQPFVLSVGRLWDEAKNVRGLDAVAARLEWPVHVAGEVKQLGADVGVDLSAARQLGQLSQTELRRWYSRASIYALPAFYEPFGLTVLEAAASRCALVLGNIESLRELWDGAALFVNPGDTEALQAALQQLIEDETLRLDLGNRAQTRARMFSARHMARQYVALYEAAMQSRRAPGGELRDSRADLQPESPSYSS